MIRKYRTTDFEKVYNITYYHWEDEASFSDDVKELIYTLLVNYSYLNQGLSYVDVVDGEVQAFCFACFKNDKSLIVSLENEYAIKYFNYLDYNHEKTISLMNDNDVYISLLASINPGSGLKLLKKIEEEAKKRNTNAIFLWTDETCNHSYYLNNGFNIVEEYNVNFFNKNIKTYIYKKEKE